jgi:hypothetical protein
MRSPLKRKSSNRGQVSRVYEQTAPVKGWIANETIVGADEGGAYQLDNWIPEPNAIRLRAGYSRHSFVYGNTPIDTLMVYQAGGVQTLFACSNGQIVDVTAQLPAGWATFFWSPYEVSYAGATAKPWSQQFWGPYEAAFSRG